MSVFWIAGIVLNLCIALLVLRWVGKNMARTESCRREKTPPPKEQ